jgi:hypothetical protein
MRSSLANRSKPFRCVTLIALVAVLTLLLSGWSCFVGFESCQGVGQAQIISLSPISIPSDVNSVPLTVVGKGFTPQSQITWNGSTLETTFMDSRHLQTTITQDTFDNFGGGSSAKISVRSQALGCPINGNPAALVLVIK